MYDPRTGLALARLRMADELALAERQRRLRLARGEPAPDVVRFDEPVAYPTFFARLRAAAAAVLSTGRGGLSPA